jgi:hypothetical protein
MLQVWRSVTRFAVVAAATRALGIVRVVGRYDGTSIGTFSYQEYEQLRDQGRSLAFAVATSTPQSVLCVLPGIETG